MDAVAAGTAAVDAVAVDAVAVDNVAFDAIAVDAVAVDAAVVDAVAVKLRTLLQWTRLRSEACPARAANHSHESISLFVHHTHTLRQCPSFGARRQLRYLGPPCSLPPSTPTARAGWPGAEAPNHGMVWCRNTKPWRGLDGLGVRARACPLTPHTTRILPTS